MDVPLLMPTVLAIVVLALSAAASAPETLERRTILAVRVSGLIHIDEGTSRRCRPNNGARGFALIMIATGLVALQLSALEHRRSMRAMREEFGPGPIWTAAAVATLVSLLGCWPSRR
jgi:hypothetical protein